MILSLSGYAGSGKDSVADILVRKYGFKKYAWADSLRIAASVLNPIVMCSDNGSEPLRYNDAIELVGYTQAKSVLPEVRRFLQVLGTDVGRNMISDTVWVDATLRRLENETSSSDDIVIADTRFQNEIDAVKSLSDESYAVRVHRPGVVAMSDHPSEVELDNYSFDVVLNNDGDLRDLESRVVEMLAWVETYSWGLHPR